ncbi:MAG: amidase [Verrucomicrobiales bacterium]|jgi:amidase
MPDTPEHLYWSATRIAAEIRAGAMSSVEVVRSVLERIDDVNPKLNAVVQLARHRALAEATECDVLTAKGQFRGPLHGVPITIKDSLDTEGIISTGGTLGRKDFVPSADAPVVARLRSAGAVVVGKTNTPELTLSGETDNVIYGRTNNPFDVERSPGGSSGGSAAIIASGGSYLELGSDTGGSIREPAHLCGITGIKPTSGRTPRTGHIVPYGGGVMDSLTQIGPMARYVEDLALALPIICGPDGEDPSCVPVPLRSPTDLDPTKLRIAFFSDNGVVDACADNVRVVVETADALRDAGLPVTQQPLPGMTRLAELSKELRDAVGEGYILRLLDLHGTESPGPTLAAYFTNRASEGRVVLDPTLLERIDRAKSEALRFMADYDAILCPPSKELARPHGASNADAFDDWSYIMMVNLLGWPGLSVRAGTSRIHALPVGVQIIAAPWREDIALAVGQKVETLMGGFRRPPIG